jgi:hypothetical protein
MMVCQLGRLPSDAVIMGSRRWDWPCVLEVHQEDSSAFGMMMNCDDMMKVKNEKSIDQQYVDSEAE